MPTLQSTNVARRGLAVLLCTWLMAGCSGNSTPDPDRLRAPSAETPSNHTRETPSSEKQSSVESSADAFPSEPPANGLAREIGAVPASVPNQANDFATANPADGSVPAETRANLENLENAGTRPALQPIRLLLLADGGPILVDAHLRVDGIPIRLAVEQLYQAYFEMADTNNDARVSWDEMLREPNVNNRQFGQAPVESAENRRALTFTYDLNRNQRVDAAEILRFLLRDATSARWMIEVQAAANSDESPLFRWLDQNGDNRLDGHERHSARQRVELLDADGNGRVDVAELNRMTSPPTSSASSSSARPLAHWLHPDVDWSRLLFSLEEHYAYGSAMQADDLRSRLDLFHELDVNDDGAWSPSEVAQLLARPADVTVSLDLGPAVDTPAELTQQAHRDDELAESMSPTRNQPSLTIAQSFRVAALDNARLEIRSLADPSEFRRFEVVHREWHRWDANSDGVLDRDEFAAAEAFVGVPWPYCDPNRDDQLTRDELIETRWRTEQASRCVVRFAFSANANSLWSRIDQNDDQRISKRELGQLTESLEQLCDESGELRVADLPSAMLLRVRRGKEIIDATNDRQEEFRASMQGDSAESGTANWFRAMDRNRDGEIDTDEFLGSSAQFQALDQDRDGFIEDHETK